MKYVITLALMLIFSIMAYAKTYAQCKLQWQGQIGVSGDGRNYWKSNIYENMCLERANYLSSPGTNCESNYNVLCNVHAQMGGKQQYWLISGCPSSRRC